MNLIDRLVGYVSPQAGWKRRQFRLMAAAYDAATPSTLRKFSRDHQSGDAHARASARSIRAQARHLDRNHDLSHGALTTMVNNIVGPHGIAVEPQPRSVSGELLEDLAQQLLELYRNWCANPEVTGEHNFAAVQRLECRTWLRDGEAFAQILEGDVANLDHLTTVPMSLEMLEPDMVPTGDELFIRDGKGGIVRNAWGRAVSYRVFKVHPGDPYGWRQTNNLKTIPADRMLHVNRVDRIGQMRGVSIFASVITRLEDVKDYEESERIAAKIAASMAGFIKKGTPDLYTPPDNADGTTAPRPLRFQPGMIFDDLMPGEEIGTIDTSRPNTNMQHHRDGQLRAAAAGLGVSYSSISRNYNGTWSAQRQELVEQWANYAVLAEEFTSQFVRPVWERFVRLAVLSGAVKVPADIDEGSLDDALFIAQQMPWIDPKKEADAFETLEANAWMSGPEIIRRRGANPRDVIAQEAKWQRQKKEAGIESAVKPPSPPPPPPPDPNEPDPNNPETQGEGNQ